MKTTITKRILKLEGLIEAEGRQRVPGIAELLRERYAVRARQGLPPDVPQRGIGGLTLAEILRSRYAKLERDADQRERVGDDKQTDSQTC